VQQKACRKHVSCVDRRARLLTQLTAINSLYLQEGQQYVQQKACRKHVSCVDRRARLLTQLTAINSLYLQEREHQQCRCSIMSAAATDMQQTTRSLLYARMYDDGLRVHRYCGRNRHVPIAVAASRLPALPSPPRPRRQAALQGELVAFSFA
jgi:hypothetical protein